MTKEEREKAINALRISAPVMAVTHEEFNDYIQTLNNIRDVLQQESNKWIPVSERLPKPYTWVYVTCHSLVNDWEDWVIDTIYEPQPKDSPYSDWGNIEMLNNGECEVIAWMEWISPEPYNASLTREESEG